jgi:glycerol-3-phosphate cytidylyltransferase-like family protein
MSQSFVEQELIIKPLIEKIFTKAALFGAFDLFHYGHENFLTQAMSLSKGGCVYVLSDGLIEKHKKVKPSDTQSERVLKVQNFVGKNFSVVCHTDDEEYNKHMVFLSSPDVIILGEDQTNVWTSSVIAMNPQAEVIFAKRTPNISSTMLRSLLCPSQ